jgi:polyhydroxyalkanoate synthesis regulator phasin
MSIADEVRSKSAQQVNDLQEMSNKWQMPEVEVGATVLWWPYAETNRDPRLADVSFVTNRTVDLTIRDGSVGHKREACRQINDPILVLKPNLKAEGAWDYTDEWKRELAEAKALDERLSQIEAAIGSSEQPNTKDLKDKLTILQRKVTALEKKVK